MKNMKWIFLIYAVLAVTSMVGLGVSLSFENIYITLMFLVTLIIVMGIGFKTKKKMRELGKI